MILGEAGGRILAVVLGMWRYRWWAALTSWTLFSVAAVGIWMMPDYYQSSARVFVDTQSVLKPLLANMTNLPNVEEQVRVMGRNLLNRPNIEKLIKTSSIASAEGARMDHEKLVRHLTNSIKLSGTGRDDIYTITYQHRDPAVAKSVVESLLAIFLDTGAGSQKQDTAKAVAFIDEQIKLYEGKLSAAENALKEFKIRNAEVLPRDGATHAAKLSATSDALQEARLDLREAEQSRNALRREVAEQSQANAEQGIVAAADPELEARLRTLYKNLDTLQTQFTDQHPDIVATRRLIADLEARRRASQEQPRPQARGGRRNGQVSQQLSLALAEAEANYAAISARVSEYSSRYAKLSALLKAVPEVESQLAGLNRDYQVNKENYEKLINRREAAKLTEEMTASGIVKFRIVEAPSVPPKPSGPHRVLWLAAALAGALLAGLGLAFLLAHLRPSFHYPAALRELTGLPVLGTVSFNWTAAARSAARRDATLFGLTLMALGLAWLGAASMR